MAEPNSASPPRPLIQALTRILRPVIRLLIRHQITYPYLAQLIKGVYLDVAMRDLQTEGERATDSRLSMLTGVHRKDIRRLREQAPTALTAPRRPASLGAQIVSAWLSLPEFSDAHGEPRPLHRLTAQGEPSFETLVNGVGKQDLRARSVLDEWLRAGLVRLDAEDRVHLQHQAFIPAEDFAQKAFFFGKNLHDHAAAAAHNLSSDKPPHFERSVYYNNLRPASVAKLRAIVDDDAMTLLKRINRKARELQTHDSGDAQANERFTLGVYFYTETHQDEPHDAPPSS